MYRFKLNIQLIGIGVAHIPRNIDNVSFTNLEGKLYATVELQSRYKRKISKQRMNDAIMKINEAISKLSFIYKVKITLSENGYIMKRLFPYDSPYFTCRIFTSTYSINMDHESLSEKISNLKPIMKPLLNKALAYYQAALESENPHIRTILLVSCISSIIKDEYQIVRDLTISDLVTHLEHIRKVKRMKKDNFKKLIHKIYGLRSKPGHGNIDIKEGMVLRATIPYYKKLNQIVDIYIEKFLEKYSVSNKDNRYLQTSSDEIGHE